MHDTRSNPTPGERIDPTGTEHGTGPDGPGPVFRELETGLYVCDGDDGHAWLDPAAILKARGEEPTQELCAVMFSTFHQVFAAANVQLILITPDGVPSLRHQGTPH